MVETGGLENRLALTGHGGSNPSPSDNSACHPPYMSAPNELGPAAASRIKAAWLRITGRDKWLPAVARVYSCEYADLPEQINSPVGHYTVVYSYSAGGERYVGKFVDFGRAVESYFKRDDAVEIRYNPRHPAKSYYPQRRTQAKLHLVSLGVGIVLALIALAIARWAHSDRFW